VSHRVDVDPEAVSDRPPFCHRFLGVSPNIRCVPITNFDDHNESVRLNTSTECPRGSGCGQEWALLRMGRAARERAEAAARAVQLETGRDREYHRTRAYIRHRGAI